VLIINARSKKVKKISVDESNAWYIITKIDSRGLFRQIQNKFFMKELQENIIDKGKEGSHWGREIILKK